MFEKSLTWATRTLEPCTSQAIWVSTPTPGATTPRGSLQQELAIYMNEQRNIWRIGPISNAYTCDTVQDPDTNIFNSTPVQITQDAGYNPFTTISWIDSQGQGYPVSDIKILAWSDELQLASDAQAALTVKTLSHYNSDGDGVLNFIEKSKLRMDHYPDYSPADFSTLIDGTNGDDNILSEDEFLMLSNTWDEPAAAAATGQISTQVTNAPTGTIVQYKILVAENEWNRKISENTNQELNSVLGDLSGMTFLKELIRDYMNNNGITTIDNISNPLPINRIGQSYDEFSNQVEQPIFNTHINAYYITFNIDSSEEQELEDLIGLYQDGTIINMQINDVDVNHPVIPIPHCYHHNHETPAVVREADGEKCLRRMPPGGQPMSIVIFNDSLLPCDGARPSCTE